jgi:hypothetical protein
MKGNRPYDEASKLTRSAFIGCPRSSQLGAVWDGRCRRLARRMIGLAAILSLGCGGMNPNDSRPARRMREALRVGMSLEEVCATVTPLETEPSDCIIGRGCEGEWQILGLQKAHVGYTVSRHHRDGTSEQDMTLATPSQVAQALDALRTCSLLKVGHGYYDVHLKLDANGRVREISPVLIEDNPDAPLS